MEFIVDYYIIANGRRPAGRGMWAFARMRNPDDNEVFFTFGMYGEAKAEARRHFAGEKKVYVLP